jgi:hypothetical protein
MHRSGTSVIARSLPALGVGLGVRLLPPGSDNGKGFWEDTDLVDLNKSLLIELGHQWYSLQPLQWERLSPPTAAEFQDNALNLLKSRLAGAAGCFGFKDPRTACLLPFWRRVFARLSTNVSYVIACRNPVSVKESLASRDGMAAAHAYRLWLDHMTFCLEETVGRQRIVVDYDLLMSDPGNQIGRMADHLNLPFHPNGKEFSRYRDGFLDTSLCHSRFRPEDLEKEAELPPAVLGMYGLLHRLATDDLRFDVDGEKEIAGYLKTMDVDGVDSCTYVTRFSANAGISLAAELVKRDREIMTLTQEIKEINRLLDGCYESRSWKITAPLRGAMQCWREKRRKFFDLLTRTRDMTGLHR